MPWEADNDGDLQLIDGQYRDGSVDVSEPSLTFAMAIPAGRRWSVDTRLAFRNLDFTRTGATDPAFVMPSDTTEVGFDVEVTHRWRTFTASIGLEFGYRLDWQRWGIDRREEARTSYSVTRLELSSFRRVGEYQTLGFDVAAFGSDQLDRFSRVPKGRARATVTSFSTGIGFDEGLFAGVSYGTRLFGRFPVGFELDGSRQRIAETEWEDRIGGAFRFKVHGPWRTDLWPSIRYSIRSTVPEEEGDVSYGLVIRRRY